MTVKGQPRLSLEDTPLAIGCPECGNVANLTPRQLRASLAAQCRKCKRNLSEVAEAALRTFEDVKPEASAEWIRRGGDADGDRRPVNRIKQSGKKASSAREKA